MWCEIRPYHFCTTPPKIHPPFPAGPVLFRARTADEMASDDSGEWYTKSPMPQAQAFDFSSSSPEAERSMLSSSLPGTPTLADHLDNLGGDESPMSLDSLASPTARVYEEDDSLDALLRTSGGAPPPLGISSDADRDTSYEYEEDDELFIEDVLSSRQQDPIFVLIYHHRVDRIPTVFAYRESFLRRQSVMHDFAREQGVTISVHLFITTFLLSDQSTAQGRRAFFEEWDRWLATPDALANNLIQPVKEPAGQTSRTLYEGSRLIQLFS